MIHKQGSSLVDTGYQTPKLALGLKTSYNTHN